jgi:outer membrane protein assembly factor BamA
MKIFVCRQCFCSLTFFLILAGYFYCNSGYAQVQPAPDQKKDTIPAVIINHINIDGNTITRSSIIYRELGFREHDTIPLEQLPQLLKTSRENVFNTTLFNIVTVDTISAGISQVMSLQILNINIHVIERWYIWPWPYFLISDRNFNSWLQTTDFSMVTYGINMTFYNVRGRNETLVFPLHFGFNQRFGAAYRFPYINRKKTLGFGFGVNYDRNHEVVVQSIDNKPVYFKDFQNYPMQMGIAFLDLYLRKNIYARHTFHLEYDQVYFSDSLIKIPGYSFDAKTNGFHYFTFFYQFKYDHRDIQFYPLQGCYFDVNVSQSGFFDNEVNLFSVRSSFRKYWKLYDRWHFASGVQGKVSLPGDQPYFLQRGLGYGRDFIRGYEYYVIDGQQYMILKNNVKFSLIPQKVAVSGFLKSVKFNTIPYALYLNIFADFGYVYNEDKTQNALNNLQNELLIGYGAGLDFTTYYDLVIRLECSINRMGRPGLYLHFIAPI